MFVSGDILLIVCADVLFDRAVCCRVSLLSCCVSVDFHCAEAAAGMSNATRIIDRIENPASQLNKGDFGAFRCDL